MGAVWKSLREYAVVVAKQWWFYVGLVSGILALVGQVTSLPPIPRGVGIAGFVLFLSLAQFAAFHQLRLQRDEGDQPGFSLLAQAPRWLLSGYAYTTEAHDTLLGTPQAFVGDPEIRLTFVTDIEMEAHGGAKGGVLFGLTWTIRNLPDAATFEAPVVTMPISLPAGQGAPLRFHLSVELDKIRLSDLRRVWDELGGDPVLIAEYRVKGRSTSVETRLTLPRTYIVAAIAPWRKMVGLPPEA
jgi:hypothetical protein